MKISSKILYDQRQQQAQSMHRKEELKRENVHKRRRKSNEPTKQIDEKTKSRTERTQKSYRYSCMCPATVRIVMMNFDFSFARRFCCCRCRGRQYTHIVPIVRVNNTNLSVIFFVYTIYAYVQTHHSNQINCLIYFNGVQMSSFFSHSAPSI